jgi:hypothetical protein
MATKMTKSTVGAKTAGPSKQYMKTGGTKKAQAGTQVSDTTRMAAIGMVPDPSKPGLYKKNPNKGKTAVKKMGGKANTKMMYGGMKKGGMKKGK